MTIAEAAPEVLTASPRSVLRRRAGWIVVAVFVLLGVLVLVLVQSSGPAADEPFSATNPKPDGSMAVVQVLQQHGVHVITTDSLEETRRVADREQDATILVYDPQSLMSEQQRRDAVGLGDDLVAVQPDLLAISDFISGIGLTGELTGTFRADCDVAAVQKARTVTASGLGYRITDDSRDPTACLGKEAASGLIQAQVDGKSVTVLGLGTVLQNGTIGSQGDAALALNLLGAHPTLIWYISTYADLQQDSTATLGDLTPPWVTPLILLLLVAGVAAAVWRGRRFGPLVVENLPVVVRASETMEGRARLYSRARARLRALDALRIGTVDRLARAVGLPRTATVDEVVSAVAALIGRDRSEVAGILLDLAPGSDAELVRLSDDLLKLEAAVAATSPGSTTPQNGQHG
jgi:hypothetical protein